MPKLTFEIHTKACRTISTNKNSRRSEPWTRTKYSYDNLNRLVGATAPSTQPSGVSVYYAGVTPAWVYDAFGNRKSETWGGTGTASVPTSSSATYTTASNQVVCVKLGGLTYDAAGNVTDDG